MKLPAGFRAAGFRAGVKPSGKPDLGLIFADAPLAWAYSSTTNLLRAACVTRNRARYDSGELVRGLVVNSGNANCATGQEGVLDDMRFAEAAAAALGLDPVQLLTASTGVVGRKLPVEKLEIALPNVVAALSADAEAFAEAILTTDLVPKVIRLELPGGASIVGVAKGSGMIHPNMATMLAFVMTDAQVSQPELRALWPKVVAQSFNQVTVDGDTSPNDMALAFSSARLEADPEVLREGLLAVCQDLARMIARDGEGATKLLTVSVMGAASDEAARLAARSVARSPLVKSAVHGNDPNWGRILAAVGYSGADADMGRVRISLQGTPVYDAAPQPFDASDLSWAMRGEEVTIDIDLARGVGTGQAWGCDLSADYVRINADYTT